MRNLVILPFILFSFSSLAQNDTLSIISTNRICWTQNFTLSWDDFLAEADTTYSESALSSIVIPYSYQVDSNGNIIIYTNTCFQKNASWVDDNHKNNLLLKHEQLHFDIAELYRRKIVKALTNIKITRDNVKPILASIVVHYWTEEYPKTQKLYDQETNYSLFISKQIDWISKVSNELKALEAFKTNKLVISPQY